MAQDSSTVEEPTESKRTCGPGCIVGIMIAVCLLIGIISGYLAYRRKTSADRPVAKPTEPFAAKSRDVGAPMAVVEHGVRTLPISSHGQSISPTVENLESRDVQMFIVSESEIPAKQIPEHELFPIHVVAPPEKLSEGRNDPLELIPVSLHYWRLRRAFAVSRRGLQMLPPSSEPLPNDAS